MSDTENNEVPLLKEKVEKKKRPPKSEKQMEAFKKIAEKRSINIKLRKVDEAKKLIEEVEEIKAKREMKREPSPTPEVLSESSESESSTESESSEEIIIKPKRNKIKKNPIKKMVKKEFTKLLKKNYKEESSSSESEIEEVKPVELPKRTFKTQQNKKTIINTVQTNLNQDFGKFFI